MTPFDKQDPITLGQLKYLPINKKKELSNIFCRFIHIYSSCIFFSKRIDYIYAYPIVNNIGGPNVVLNFLPKSCFSSPTYTFATSERSFGIVSLGHLGSRLLRSYVSPRPPDPMPSGYLLPVAFMYV